MNKKIWSIIDILILVFFCLALMSNPDLAQAQSTVQEIRGRIIDAEKRAPVVGAIVKAITAFGNSETLTDEQGHFSLSAKDSAGTLTIVGDNIKEKSVNFTVGNKDLDLEISYIIAPVHEAVVIRAVTIEPQINRQDDTLYKEGFAARDDQIFFQFGSGINAGQHEGGGKSLEIRRFGFNLDHGGVGPGLLVRVDNFDQNQATQGHGQGYLGQLKSLTSELVGEVQVINGPFSAQYGNFSGLGVVQVSLRDSLAQTAILKLQGGSFDTKRGFFAVSPHNGYIAYELSRTDTPFQKPYSRDNITTSYRFDLAAQKKLAFKLNFGRNDFFSAGQIPVDLIQQRQLGRFSAIDGSEGGEVRTFNASVLFSKEYQDGSALKADLLIARSLFDLYNNFTFFLENEALGDQFNQHDSRLQQGGNIQYLKPYTVAGRSALLAAGGGYIGNQILVTLNKSFQRDPYLNITFVNAKIATYNGYVQNNLDFGKLHVDLGLRYDLFYFGVKDRNFPRFNGADVAGKVQPKLGLAYHPFLTTPLSFYFNYGQGVTSQDARGVAQRPEGPKLSTTDFYQTGFAYNKQWFNLTGTLFLIDNSATQVYITDDNSIEFQDPSRSYGYEFKGSVRINSHLGFNASVTRVINAFFRGTRPREFLSNAPSVTGNANLIMSNIKGFSGVVSYRHINSYILDSIDTSMRGSGHDIVDFKLSKRLYRGFELSMGIDNLFNKKYFEVQNFGESRARPGDPIISRIHGTPGYPFTLSFGVTFKFGER